jgi:hypothetical protein
VSPTLWGLRFYVAANWPHIVKVISGCISKVIVACVFVRLTGAWFVVVSFQTLYESFALGVNKKTLLTHTVAQHAIYSIYPVFDGVVGPG